LIQALEYAGRQATKGAVYRMVLGITPILDPDDDPLVDTIAHLRAAGIEVVYASKPFSPFDYAAAPPAADRIYRALGGDPSFLLLLDFVRHYNPVAENGAVGGNISSFREVATQRHAVWTLRYALASGLHDSFEEVMKAIEYAFDHQTDSGYFDNSLGVDPVTAVGIDAFFLQALGLADDVLQGVAGADLIARMDTLVARRVSAMEWLADQETELRRQDNYATNRLAFDAVAFLGNGRALQDPTLTQIGVGLTEDVLARQDEDGVFPEYEGYDSSYQAVTLINLLVVTRLLDDTSLRQRVFEALDAGYAWEQTRILPTGEVLVEGNARTGFGQEVWNGTAKEVNYAEVAFALFYWSELNSDPSMRKMAQSVIRYALRSRGLIP